MTEHFVGIDIGASRLHVGIATEQGQVTLSEVTNDPEGIAGLVARLKASNIVRVVCEATGPYGLSLLVALHRANIRVMRANPRAVKSFAHALMRRAKTDRVDAVTLVEFARRMPFEAWAPPPDEVLVLRGLVRRIDDLVGIIASEKARRHAADHDPTLPADIQASIATTIEFLELQVDQLQKSAVALVQAHPTLKIDFMLLDTMPGVAERTALRILSEVLALPDDLSVKQTVAMFGLDPRPCESGNFEGQRQISKRGNPRVRKTLYMVALTAIRMDPHVRRFYDDVLARVGGTTAAGARKKRASVSKKAHVAVMRKLVHAIVGILRTKTPYDGQKFRALPAA